MNYSPPLITIGITCYNAAATIARALHSAVAQDWPKFEIIVVDDASTDDSLAIIHDFAAHHDALGIRVIAKPDNQGYPAALNTLIEEAAGAFVAFFDDDDESAPDRLTAQMARLRAYESTFPGASVLCYANRAVIRPDASAPDHIARAIGRTSREPHGPSIADFILWSNGAPGYSWGMFGSCTLLARASLLRDLCGFDENFRRSAEWDFAARHALAGGHCIAVDRPLVTQYKTESADKAGRIPLRYAIQLRYKHKAYLQRRRTYWGALLIARSRYHGAMGHKWRGRMFYALASLLSFRILRERLTRHDEQPS